MEKCIGITARLKERLRNMIKVSLCARELRPPFYKVVSGIISIYGVYLGLCPEGCQLQNTVALFLLIAACYFVVFLYANLKRRLKLEIRGVSVVVREGDIFDEDDRFDRVIAFNRYFDTCVDNELISQESLNGQYLQRLSEEEIASLDAGIKNDLYMQRRIEREGLNRLHPNAKKIEYRCGSIYRNGRYLLAAMTKFDDNNVAGLTEREYIEFLLELWSEVNRVCQGRSVRVPLLSGGLSRLSGLTEEEKVRAMLGTLSMGGVRFPSGMTIEIVLTKEAMSKVSLLKIKQSFC